MKIKFVTSMMLRRDIYSNTTGSITTIPQAIKQEVGVLIDNTLLIDFCQDRNVNMTGSVFLENVGRFVLELIRGVIVVLMKSAFKELSANLEFVRI